MLSPDDQAFSLTSVDYTLFAQLEYAVSTHFYSSCDFNTQELLAQCQWAITTSLGLPTLTISCPNSETYWHIVSNIQSISHSLAHVTHASRIEVIPGSRRNIYFEIEIGA